MRFKQQAERYIQAIQTRRRNPVRAATARIYQSYLDSHILPELGHICLEKVENGVAKKFISELNSTGLAPATINSIFNVVKAVLASAMDSDGNELYPRKWNPDFIDLPIVDKNSQDAPTVTPQQVNTAVSRAFGQDRALFTLLAASGARIGELLALKAAPDDGQNSFWDPQTGIIHVRTTLKDGRVQNDPKTRAGIRQIDLAPGVNAYLRRAGLSDRGFLFQNSLGGPIRLKTAYEHLEKAGIQEGFHAFRRFRVTHLESQNVPRGLVQFWIGHSGTTITDRYLKIGQDLVTRQDWAIRAGIGFELPKGQQE
jgi:integrase